jgi:5-methylcytosine-specific restriction protein A
MATRARVLRANPLCVACQRKGRTSIATEVDHTVPLFKGGTDDEANLAGLCDECHKVKTADDLGQAPRVTIGIDGWPVE